jgi:hypothetical protein
MCNVEKRPGQAAIDIPFMRKVPTYDLMELKETITSVISQDDLNISKVFLADPFHRQLFRHRL